MRVHGFFFLVETEGLRTPAEHGSALQAALRSRWSLQILYLFLTCGLNAFLSPTHFIKKKSLCFAQAFLFGGNRRASSAGALNPHLAFSELNKPLSAPVGRCRFSVFFLFAA